MALASAKSFNIPQKNSLYQSFRRILCVSNRPANSPGMIKVHVFPLFEQRLMIRQGQPFQVNGNVQKPPYRIVFSSLRNEVQQTISAKTDLQYHKLSVEYDIFKGTGAKLCLTGTNQEQAKSRAHCQMSTDQILPSATAFPHSIKPAPVSAGAQLCRKV